MLVALVEDSCAVLSGFTGPEKASRELVMAYATLAGFIGHWPSQATSLHKALLQKFRWVRDAEEDRYLKQRRIAIERLSVQIV